MCKTQEHIVSSAFRNCVNRKHVCDGMKDCPKGDDEDKCPVRRACGPADKCDSYCINKADGKPACACPLGFLLAEDERR